MYSPLELDQIEFEKKTFGGYNVEEVEKVFENLKKDYGTLYIENADMKKTIKELENKLAASESMAETMKEVMISAQKTSDEVRENARVEAELIKKTAEAEASEIIRKAEYEVEVLTRRREEVKSEVELFITKMSALFEAQVKHLNKTE